MPDIPMTEAEIDRLEKLLESPPAGANPLWLDSMQGFLAAVVTGPKPVPESVWLPVAMGAEGAWSTDAAAQELVGLLERMRTDILQSLSLGEELPFLLYGDEKNTDAFDIEPWVAGYLEGVGLADPEWDAAVDGETVDELLFPMLVLGGALDQDQAWKAELAPDADTEAELKARCRDSLPAAVQEAFDFWVDWRKPETVRHTTPKVGRNDPCPCGSGKKYKLCHGMQ